jgi:prepilin-type N-terminal cleavage/methylation domain-containing protein
MQKKYFQKRNPSSRSGFSLIELLVVAAIIGIVTAIVIVGLTTHKDQKDAENAALVAASKVREAQSAALTGRQYLANTTPCSYRVAWGTTNITNTYIYKDGSGNCTQSSVMNTAILPGGAAFSGSGTIDFVLPHGAIVSDYTLAIQKNAASRVVCVKTQGLVEVQPLASNC